MTFCTEEVFLILIYFCFTSSCFCCRKNSRHSITSVFASSTATYGRNECCRCESIHWNTYYYILMHMTDITNARFHASDWFQHKPNVQHRERHCETAAPVFWCEKLPWSYRYQVLHFVQRSAWLWTGSGIFRGQAEGENIKHVSKIIKHVSNLPAFWNHASASLLMYLKPCNLIFRSCCW